MATRLQGTVDKCEQKKREHILQQINLDCKEKFYNQNKNTIHKVLIEEVVDEKFSLGYTGNYIYTYIDAKCKPGEIVEVRLTDLYNNGMKAILI